jgi:carbamoyltransferase
MWRRLNAKVKYREDFRPLAPVVPVELAGRYFELDEPSPYMLRVVKIREEYRERLGAVCHVDGTARVQTVDRDLLPRLHELLLHVGELTGLPVLVNTSLNRRGEPIIEDPRDAIAMLLTTDLDALVMGQHLLVPKRPPNGELDMDMLVALSPGTRVVCESSPQGAQARIESSVGGKEGYYLPLWCAVALMEADGRTPLKTLVERYLPVEITPDRVAPLLRDLFREQLLIMADS